MSPRQSRWNIPKQCPPHTNSSVSSWSQIEHDPDLKLDSDFSELFLCSRLRFRPTSSFEELSVSSEELAVRSSEDEAIAVATARGRWDKGRSKSRSTEGESSELEVGGVKIADVMLCEEPPMPVLLVETAETSGATESEDKPSTGFLS